MIAEGGELSMVNTMAPRVAEFVDAAGAAHVRLPPTWSELYRLGPNRYLSEVWLEQAHRWRRGADQTIKVGELVQWNGDLLAISLLPRPGDRDELLLRAFENSEPRPLEVTSRGIRTVIMTGVVINARVETTAPQASLSATITSCSSKIGLRTYDELDDDATLRNIDALPGQVCER